MSNFLEARELKETAAELYDEVLGHLETLSEGWMKDEFSEFAIKESTMKRIARLIRAEFEHQLNNLTESDIEHT
jgi:hypothetical protein